MLKSRMALVLAISLLILGAALYTLVNRTARTLPAFAASVRRDCAPADGPAFTVEIPLQDGRVISISVWQSPDIIFPKTFSFMNDSRQPGNVSLIHPAGLSEQLVGEVTFQHVQQATPIEGQFRLRSEGGEQFEGQFEAKWDGQVVFCG
jgi:hypothetical protein